VNGGIIGGDLGPVPQIVTVTGTFEVGAGTTGKATLDVAGLTPDQIAELFIQKSDAYADVCHQCARNIEDPEVGDLVSFTVDGVSYEFQDGHWVPYSFPEKGNK
jgi:hypothetical protein